MSSSGPSEKVKKEQERRWRKEPGPHGVWVSRRSMSGSPLCSTIVYYLRLWMLLWSSAPPCSSLGTDYIIMSLVAVTEYRKGQLRKDGFVLAHNWRVKSTMVVGA